VLTKKPNGILHTISDESALGQQQVSTAQLTEKILALQRVFPDVIKRNKTKPNVFLLQHYCEQVEYCTDYMTRKNRISSGIAALCRSSANTCLAEGYSAYQGTALVSTRNISSQIVLCREQMDRLAQMLRSASSLHWIRCVKPNNDRSPATIDAGLVLAQLNSSGVSRTLSLLAEGYSVRVPHDVFVTKYLAPALRAHFRGLRSAPKKEESFAAVEDLLRTAKHREVCVLASKLLPACQNKKLIVGATKAFLRTRTLQELQGSVLALYQSTVAGVQRFGRGFLDRKKLVPLRMKLLEAKRLAACRARIMRELPAREALEQERVELHAKSAEERQCDLRGLHLRMQRSSSLVLQKVKLATDLIASELQRACNEVMAYDSVREKKETELRELAEFHAHYAEVAAQALETSRQQLRDKEAARKRQLELERAKAEAARGRSQRALSADKEHQMVQAVLAAQAAQVRAKLQAEGELLARKAAAAEAAERRAARSHLARQHQRIAERAAIAQDQVRQEQFALNRLAALHSRAVTGVSSPSPARRLGASPGRGLLTARGPSPDRRPAPRQLTDDERHWTMQQDLWEVWERANHPDTGTMTAAHSHRGAQQRFSGVASRSPGLVGTPRR
jgi:myosin heavy subunit